MSWFGGAKEEKKSEDYSMDASFASAKGRTDPLGNSKESPQTMVQTMRTTPMSQGQGGFGGMPSHMDDNQKIVV